MGRLFLLYQLGIWYFRICPIANNTLKSAIPGSGLMASPGQAQLGFIVVVLVGSLLIHKTLNLHYSWLRQAPRNKRDRQPDI